MIVVRVNRTTITSVRSEQLTSGLVGNQLKLEFDSSWNDLEKAVVFNGSHCRVDVEVPSEEPIVTIPYECVSRYGGHLEIGVYGYTVGENDEVTIVIPTVYYDLGEIKEGASLSGVSPSPAPSPSPSPSPSPDPDPSPSIDDLVFTATVDDTSGDPAVEVTRDGDNVTFAFTGLVGAQGEKGDDGDDAVIDNISWDDINDKPTIPTALSQLSDDTTHRLVTDSNKTAWSAKYDKPSGGIPSTDMSSAVQTSLGKADSALQSHQSLSAYRTSSDQDTIDAGKQSKITYGTSDPDPSAGSVGDVYIKITE